MAVYSSLSSPPPNLLQKSTKHFIVPSTSILKATNFQPPFKFTISPLSASVKYPKKLFAAAIIASAETSSVAARRVYIGNIPRTVDNTQLTQIVEEHGAIDKAEVMYDKYSGRSRRFAFVTMKTVEDANAVVEKLNGTEIGGRKVKVNITEKPLLQIDFSLLQDEESQFIDSPHKVYVGNLAKTVTSDTLKSFFSNKGKVLGAKVSRVPGTSNSCGFGFVTFSTIEDVEAAISSLNGAINRAQSMGYSAWQGIEIPSIKLLEGQNIRVNKS